MITDLDDTVEFQDQHVVPQDRAGGPESLEYQDLAAHRNDTVPVQVEVRLIKAFTVSTSTMGMPGTLRGR